MRRFLLLLAHEIRLARTTIPIHAVAILQPAIMYTLMTVILVQPTFDVRVTRPTTEIERALVAAMQAVGSPDGVPYIRPVLVDMTEPHGVRQVITVEARDGVPTAVQRYNLIDNNLVKNYRNRLTAATLGLWNARLGDRAVTVVEHPGLPRDISYNVYFGLAMLPLTAFLAATLIGAALTAQEFELHTIVEYRLAPISSGLVLAARLVRLTLSSLIAIGLLLVAVGLLNGVWPDSLWWVGLILLPVAVIAGCLGIIAGLLLRTTLPAFLVGLVTSFVGWIVGGAFIPAPTIGGWYEFFSRLTPNAYAIQLLFPRYYGTAIGSGPAAALILILVSAGMTGLALFVYRRRVSMQV